MSSVAPAQAAASCRSPVHCGTETEPIAHIPDGVLSAPILLGGAVLAAGLLSVAVRRLEYDQIPQAAMLSAALFVASLISIPVGPGSVHLLLNGLMGLLLGWTAVPAILVALLLQAVFFGFGGLLVLGVNLGNIALPALLCGALLGPRLRSGRGSPAMLGAAAGALGVVLTALLVALTVGLSSADYRPAAKVLLLTYLPLIVVEAVAAAAVLGFVHRVAPELLPGRSGDAG